MMKTTLVIPSNRGAERIELTVTESTSPVVTEARFVHDETSWSSGRAVTVSGLEVFGPFLPVLLKATKEWLERGTEGQCSWKAGGSTLGFHLGFVPDIIIMVEKVALRVEFKSLLLSCDFTMVVDQSCLRLFTEQAEDYHFTGPAAINGDGPEIHPDSPIA